MEPVQSLWVKGVLRWRCHQHSPSTFNGWTPLHNLCRVLNPTPAPVIRGEEAPQAHYYPIHSQPFFDNSYPLHRSSFSFIENRLCYYLPLQPVSGYFKSAFHVRSTSLACFIFLALHALTQINIHMLYYIVRYHLLQAQDKKVLKYLVFKDLKNSPAIQNFHISSKLFTVFQRLPNSSTPQAVHSVKARLQKAMSSWHHKWTSLLACLVHMFIKLDFHCMLIF